MARERRSPCAGIGKILYSRAIARLPDVQPALLASSALGERGGRPSKHGLEAPGADRARKCVREQEMAIDMSMPVLVVDDYNTMIRIIRNLLKQLGFEDVDDASDGSAALAKMREKKYGLVISDWNMEPMTGYELLKEVRADPGLNKTPFIMVTAESKTENVIAAKKAGVNNYIVKPFNAQTLKTKIEAVFAE
jgi:two-component system chemotaxis response regulator CheY